MLVDEFWLQPDRYKHGKLCIPGSPPSTHTDTPFIYSSLLCNMWFSAQQFVKHSSSCTWTFFVNEMCVSCLNFVKVMWVVLAGAKAATTTKAFWVAIRGLLDASVSGCSHVVHTSPSLWDCFRWKLNVWSLRNGSDKWFRVSYTMSRVLFIPYERVISALENVPIYCCSKQNNRYIRYLWLCMCACWHIDQWILSGFFVCHIDMQFIGLCVLCLLIVSVPLWSFCALLSLALFLPLFFFLLVCNVEIQKICAHA